MSRHPVIKFLSTLPQFAAQNLSDAVVHLRYGTVVSLIEYDEPKFKGMLSLRWPGQARDEVCFVDMEKYVSLQISDASAMWLQEETDHFQREGTAALEAARSA